MYGCFACMHVHVPLVCHPWSLQRPEEEGIRPLELELQMVVSCHVGAGNETGSLEE